MTWQVKESAQLSIETSWRKSFVKIGYATISTDGGDHVASITLSYRDGRCTAFIRMADRLIFTASADGNGSVETGQAIAAAAATALKGYDPPFCAPEVYRRALSALAFRKDHWDERIRPDDGLILRRHQWR